MSVRVVAYVDGFNLYHGIHQYSRRRDLWLDVAGMLRRHFVDPSRGQERGALLHRSGQRAGASPAGHLPAGLAGSQSRAHGSSGPVHAQDRGLPRVRGHLGHARGEGVRDVALAVQLVQDAGLKAYDRALLVSADSDMCPAIRAAKAVAPDRQVVAVFPPGRSSMDVRQTADVTLKIFGRAPRRHQLPAVVKAPGRTYHRPPYWT